MPFQNRGPTKDRNGLLIPNRTEKYRKGLIFAMLSYKKKYVKL